MPDTTDQPTEVFTQHTLDDFEGAYNDPSVQTAIKDPSVVNIVNAVKDPEVQHALEALPLIYTETRAGYKTTEFWLTVAGLAALNLNGVILTLPDKWQAVGTAVLAGLYAISRGFAKKGIPAVDAAKPEA